MRGRGTVLDEDGRAYDSDDETTGEHDDAEASDR